MGGCSLNPQSSGLNGPVLPGSLRHGTQEPQGRHVPGSACLCPPPPRPAWLSRWALYPCRDLRASDLSVLWAHVEPRSPASPRAPVHGAIAGTPAREAGWQEGTPRLPGDAARPFHVVESPVAPCFLLGQIHAYSLAGRGPWGPSLCSSKLLLQGPCCAPTPARLVSPAVPALSSRGPSPHHKHNWTLERGLPAPIPAMQPGPWGGSETRLS